MHLARSAHVTDINQKKDSVRHIAGAETELQKHKITDETSAAAAMVATAA
jgi:hypothetical protein